MSDTQHYFISLRLWERDPLFFAALSLSPSFSHLSPSMLLSISSPPTLPSLLSTCSICYDDCPIPLLWSAVNCSQTTEKFCSVCLLRYILARVEEGHVLPQKRLPCPCSMSNCPAMIDEEKILSLLEGQDEVIRKFSQYSLNSEVARDKNLNFCPNPQCGQVINVASFWRKAHCEHCHHSFCLKCREPHSLFLTCSMSGDMQFSLWRQSTSQGCKRCPSCRMFIEKNDGCSHMTCSRCRHEFCWDCLSHWSGGCSYPKPIHAFKKLMNEDIWGKTLPTRCLTKVVGIPLICSVGCGVGGVAVGLAVGVGSVAVAGVAAGAILVSPVAGAVYVYHHPPRVLRKYLPAIPIPEPDRQRVLQQGVIVTLPWTAEDPLYLSAFSPNISSPQASLFGINGRRGSGEIFVGYLSRSSLSSSPTSSCVIYCLPRDCLARDILEIGIDPVRYESMMRVSFPPLAERVEDGETVEEREERVRTELIWAIDRELLNHPVDLTV